MNTLQNLEAGEEDPHTDEAGPDDGPALENVPHLQPMHALLPALRHQRTSLKWKVYVFRWNQKKLVSEIV